MIKLIESTIAPSSELTYSQFCDKVKSSYNNYFPNSTCDTQINRSFGNFISVSLYLVKDQSESINKILQNDMFRVYFTIDPEDRRKISGEDIMDTTYVLEVVRAWYTTNPTSPNMVYGSKKLPFRKTRGSASKLLFVIDKYFKTLHDMVEESLANGEIHKGYINIVNAKLNQPEVEDTSISEATNPKIEIHINGKYEFTTMAYRTVKDAIESLRKKKTITIASIPDRKITISDTDKITGKIIKN